MRPTRVDTCIPQTPPLGVTHATPDLEQIQTIALLRPEYLNRAQDHVTTTRSGGDNCSCLVSAISPALNSNPHILPAFGALPAKWRLGITQLCPVLYLERVLLLLTEGLVYLVNPHMQSGCYLSVMSGWKDPAGQP